MIYIDDQALLPSCDFAPPHTSVSSSVADPGCLSRIPDPVFTHPGYRISDPKTATKERGEKKIFVIPFYVATNFRKL
jgi:hypothetical protein